MDNSLNLPIQLGKEWIALQGMSYGLRQTTLVGLIKVTQNHPVKIDEIEEKIEKLGIRAFEPKANKAFSSDPLIANEHNTEKLDTEANTAYLLIQHLLFWHASIQRYQLLPVFDEYYIRTIAPEKPNEFKVALPYHHTSASKLVLEWLANTLNHIIITPPKNLDGLLNDSAKAYQHLMHQLRSYSVPGVNRYPLIKAAHQLKIPYNPLTPFLYSFGVGKNSRWLNSTFTDQTPKIGADVVQSKSATASILNQFGLPGPTHAFAANVESAIKIAQQLSYPVVVKPDDLDQGRGVYANIKNEKSLKDCFAKTAKESKKILIEKHVPGDDYRIYVINQKVVQVIKRVPGGIVGDGKQTVAELLRIKQQTGKIKSLFDKTGKMILDIDDEGMKMLQEQGLSADSVPKNQQFVPLRQRANISTGGSVEIIAMDTIHEDNMNLSLAVGNIFELDIYAVDLITKDITRSWQNNLSVICEVNVMPQFTISTFPQVFEYILQNTVPDQGLIPIHLVIIQQPQKLPNETLENLAHHYECNAISTSKGIWINNQWLSLSFKNSFDSAQAVLKYKSVHSALLVLSYADLFKFGLPITQFTSVEILKLPSDNDSLYANINDLFRLYDRVPKDLDLNPIELSPS